MPEIGGLFRLEHACGFDQPLQAPEFSSNNLLIGGLPSSSGLQALYLGKLAEYHSMQKNLWLDTEGAHVIYVMGKRRSGKTFTLVLRQC
jgi:hypothetical protein